MNWFANQRQEWIMEMLGIYGFINRQHLQRKFAISEPQAALDFRTFQERHPTAMRYDASDRTYRATKTQTCTDQENTMTKHIDSASDARTENNAVRHKYRVLSDEEKQQMVELKDMGAAFLEKCEGLGNSRELSIAKTKIEEAVMWAVKHVTA